MLKPHKYKVSPIDLILIKHHNLPKPPEIPEFSYVSYTNRDTIRCYKYREYDHFAKDYPISKEEREIEQIQQIFNLDKEQTSLKMLATDTYGSLNKINSLEII